MVSDLYWILAGAVYVGNNLLGEVKTAKNINEYVKKVGYNYDRQVKLEFMGTSTDPDDRAEFDSLVGYDWRGKDYNYFYLIREIAMKEGWTYRDGCDWNDPEYLKIIKAPKEQIKQAEEYVAKFKTNRVRQEEIIWKVLSYDLETHEYVKQKLGRNYNRGSRESVILAVKQWMDKEYLIYEELRDIGVY